MPFGPQTHPSIAAAPILIDRTRVLLPSQVLKYLVMASILHESKIDPFDSQEAKPYKQDPEIVAMTNLVVAFRNKQIKVSGGGINRSIGRGERGRGVVELFGFNITKLSRTVVSTL